MRRLIYLNAAKDDLRDILRYISQESGNAVAARNFVTLLQDKCLHLASLPGTLGTSRPELREDLRSTRCRGYVIFFRYGADRLEIVNVLHASRDILTYFDEH